MKTHLKCPVCHHEFEEYINPKPTVDIIIHRDDQIVLIYRKNDPVGWALPGGFVDVGESVEAAATREALEETSLICQELNLLGVYSDPGRDSRMHTITTVFYTDAAGKLQAADDAAKAQWFPLKALPHPIVFDHADIINDFMCKRKSDE